MTDSLKNKLIGLGYIFPVVIVLIVLQFFVIYYGWVNIYCGGHPPDNLKGAPTYEFLFSFALLLESIIVIVVSIGGTILGALFLISRGLDKIDKQPTTFKEDIKEIVKQKIQEAMKD